MAALKHTKERFQRCPLHPFDGFILHHRTPAQRCEPGLKGLGLHLGLEGRSFPKFMNAFEIQIQGMMKEAAGRRIGTHLPGRKGMQGVHAEEVRAKLGAHPSDHVLEIPEIPDTPVSPASKPIELNREAPGPTGPPHAWVEIAGRWDNDDGHCGVLGVSRSGCLQR